MFIDAQKMLIEDNTSIFVCDMIENWVVNDSVEGFYVNPLYASVVYFYDLYSK
jgi:ABC-type transport system substrate-binding protein